MRNLVKCSKMKKVCIAAVIACAAFTAKAQEDYVPFPKSDAIWDVKAYKGSLYYHTDFSGLYYFITASDTLIDEINYPSILLCNGEYVCAVREENKKVYVNLPKYGEHLLYNFNLEVGDTIFYYIGAVARTLNQIAYYGYNILYVPHYKVVTSIGTIKLADGSVRKRLNLIGWKESWFGDTWVEGIGSLDWVGVLNPFVNDMLTNGDGFALVCFEQNKEKIYISSACEDCNCWRPNNIADVLPMEISIFPNPTTGKFSVFSSQFSEMNGEIEVFDVVGCNVGTYRIRPENTETTIDISHLANGMYFLKIQTDNGTVIKKVVKE